MYLFNIISNQLAVFIYFLVVKILPIGALQFVVCHSPLDFQIRQEVSLTAPQCTCSFHRAPKLLCASPFHDQHRHPQQAVGANLIGVSIEPSEYETTGLKDPKGGVLDTHGCDETKKENILDVSAFQVFEEPCVTTHIPRRLADDLFVWKRCSKTLPSGVISFPKAEANVSTQRIQCEAWNTNLRSQIGSGLGGLCKVRICRSHGERDNL